MIMKYKYLFQTVVLLSWIFLAAIINSKFFEAEVISEGVVLICFASSGLALSLALPFLWEKLKNSNHEKQ